MCSKCRGQSLGRPLLWEFTFMLKDPGDNIVNRVIISFQVRMNNALKSWKQNVSGHTWKVEGGCGRPDNWGAWGKASLEWWHVSWAWDGTRWQSCVRPGGQPSQLQGQRGQGWEWAGCVRSLIPSGCCDRQRWQRWGQKRGDEGGGVSRGVRSQLEWSRWR